MLGCRVNLRDDGMSVEFFERGNRLYFLMISHSGVAIREDRKGSGENKVYYTHRPLQTGDMIHRCKVRWDRHLGR